MNSSNIGLWRHHRCWHYNLRGTVAEVFATIHSRMAFRGLPIWSCDVVEHKSLPIISYLETFYSQASDLTSFFLNKPNEKRTAAFLQMHKVSNASASLGQWCIIFGEHHLMMLMSHISIRSKITHAVKCPCWGEILIVAMILSLFSSLLLLISASVQQ